MRQRASSSCGRASGAAAPTRGQQVVGLVHDQPVRPAGPRPHLLQARQQRQEERRPVRERQADQVDHRVLVRGSSAAAAPRRRRGRAARVPSDDGLANVLVVPFGVDDAELVSRLGQPLQQAGGQRRFAAARGAGDQQVGAVGRTRTSVPSSRRAEQDVVPGQPAFALRAGRRPAARRSAPSTPAPWSPRVTMSARSLSGGRALATAAEHSHRLRKAWSFSASPTPTTLCGDRPHLLQGGGQPGRLVDAGRQHHHRALVEDHLQLQPQVADGFEDGGLVRLPGGDDHPADRDRLRRRAARRRLDERCRAAARPAASPLAGGAVEQGAVLGDDPLEEVDVGEDRTARSSSSRPVTRTSFRPVASRRSRAARVGSSTRPSWARVPS